jgi:hypothetical protein
METFESINIGDVFIASPICEKLYYDKCPTGSKWEIIFKDGWDGIHMQRIDKSDKGKKIQIMLSFETTLLGCPVNKRGFFQRFTRVKVGNDWEIEE